MKAVPGRVAHLTTVDATLWFLLRAQLDAVVEAGGEAVGISAPGPWVEALTERGVRHRALPSSTRRADLRADLRAARELWRILREERPEILHTHNPKPGVYGRIVGRLAGVPVVVNTVHGLYATERDPWVRRFAVYVLEAVAARFSDAELVQNPEDLALMQRRHIVPRGRGRLLENGVDLARFDPGLVSEADRSRARAELGVDDDRVLVGTVGRLVAEKGYRELVTAAGLLGSGYAVVAAGPDDPEKHDQLAPAMRAAAERAGVRFVGYRTDIERFYAALDVFVLASHREGFPRAAMEATAMGVPVVATDIRGCRQVVDPGRTGLLVPVGDGPALAGAVRELGDDADRRRAMGRAGRERARRRFDERDVVARVMEAYRELAARKARPRTGARPRPRP